MTEFMTMPNSQLTRSAADPTTTGAEGDGAAAVAEQETGKKRKKREGNALSHLDACRAVLARHGRPVAAVGRDLHSYEPGTGHGWVDVSTDLRAAVNEMLGRVPAGGAAGPFYDRCALPLGKRGYEAVVYWRWVPHTSPDPATAPTAEHNPGAGLWFGRWLPFHVKPTEVVFEGAIVDLAPPGRVTPYDAVRNPIYGPVVTLPFDPHARCDDWDRTLSMFLPDPVIHDYVQEAMSGMLQPHQHLKGFLAAVGGPDTGKSTIASACAAAPGGEGGQTNVNPDACAARAFNAFSLLHKFACVCEEWEKLGDDGRAWVKTYTGGRFTYEVKFAGLHSASPTAKLVFTSNDVPDIREDSDAMNLRTIYLPFRHRRTGDVNRNASTVTFWSNLERRKAVVAWMLRGLARVVARGGELLVPESVEEAKRELRVGTHPVLRVLAEVLEPGAPTDTVTIAEARAQLQAAGERPCRNLNALVMQLFPSAVETNRAVKLVNGGTGTGRGWTGIRVKGAGV